MKSFRKIALSLVGFSVFCFFLMTFFLSTLDPNDYKSEIENYFISKTGKKLALEGEVKIKLWPKLIVQASDVSVGSGSGFENVKLLTMNHFRLSVETLPLLFGDLKMDALVLEGFKVNLVKKEDGTTNWDFTSIEKDKNDDSTDTDAFGIFLGGIEIRESSVSIVDESANRNLSLSKINLLVDELQFDNPIKLILSLQLNDLTEELISNLDLSGSLAYNTSKKLLNFDDFKLKGDVLSPAIGGQKQDFLIDLTGFLRQKEQDITIENFELSGLGTTIKANLYGLPLVSNSNKTEGRLDLSSRDLSIPLQIFAPDLDTSSIDKKKQSAFLNIKFQADFGNGDLKIEKIESSVFGADLIGKLNVKGIHSAKPTVVGNMRMDTPDFFPLMQLYSHIAKLDLESLLANLKKVENRQLSLASILKTSLENNAIHLEKFEMKILETEISSNLKLIDFPKKAKINGSLTVKNNDLNPMLELVGQPQISDFINAGQLAVELNGAIKNLKAASKLNLYKTGNSISKTVLSAETDNILMDLERGELIISRLLLSGLGSEISATSNLSGVYSEPKAEVQFKANDINPKMWMKFFGINFETADRTALLNLQAKGTIEASKSSVEIKQMSVVLDGSTIETDAQISFSPHPQLVFDISVDQVDLDRYLAPSGRAEITPETAALGVTTLPNKLLRELNGEGKIEIEGLKISDIDLKKVEIKGLASEGLITLSPLEARIYKGHYNGHIVIDARNPDTTIKIKSSINDLDLEPLIYAKTKTRILNGITNITAHVEGTGKSSDQLLKTITGSSEIVVKNGVFIGLDAISILNTVEKIIECKCPIAIPKGGKTVFNKLTASTKISDGTLKNNDFLIEGHGFIIEGKGEANLKNETMEMKLSLQIPSSRENTRGENFNLGGYVVPVSCKGRLKNPKCKPDVEPLLKTIVKNKAKRKIEEAIGSKIKEAIGNDAEKALKKLFKF